MSTFQRILKAEKSLLTIPYETQQDFYFKERERFTRLLEAFIRQEDFSTLSGKKVIKICALVSTYRPMALHSFLIRCSNLIEETK